MKSRRLLSLSFGLMMTITSCAWAQLPSGPQKLIVGYPAGGTADAVGRLLADKLKTELDTTVIVENRAGAGGQIAAEFVKAAPPDGATVLLSNAHMMVTLPLTSRTVRYEPLKDFTMVGGIATFTEGIAVPASVPAKTLAQWIELARGDAKYRSYGVPAPGSLPQFIGYRLGALKNIGLIPVPYKGSAPLLQDLLGAQVPAGIIPIGDLAPHHHAGKLRVLAINGTKRNERLPEVPTLKELGYGDFDVLEWLGLLMPAKTPKAAIDTWQAALTRVLSMPEVKEGFSKLGVDPQLSTPDALGKLIGNDLATWGPVIRASGFQAD